LLQILPRDQQVSFVSEFSQRIPAKIIQLIVLVLTKGTKYFSRYTQLKLASALTHASMESKYDRAAITNDWLEKSETQAVECFVSKLPKKIKGLGLLLSTDIEPIITPSITSTEIFKDDFREIASSMSDEDKYPYAVSNAGLILLNPFIISFFENTGIIKPGRDHQFTPTILSRAAALLHFLSTGREDVHEWELGCIKILLGLEPERPLFISEGLLSIADKKESRALLVSVIDHWSALKGTSVTGFQSSFLQRQGLIRDEEDCWKLQVESRSFDILLDQLPWSINIVKFPWMKKAIHTEWQAL
jgi:hypothetical protein